MQSWAKKTALAAWLYALFCFVLYAMLYNNHDRAYECLLKCNL